ncbi:putative membrane or secreted protein [Candidatus Nanobsidianus stetteri]|uniref:Putative membrane or secreted protein n=1 Tax=Nanobsidianus stetteri TaxID=1294122 RepID=R1G3B6_NANST|nr:putative membrane or secreted protein [Candidatus Nanobsidianus stetteri]
MYRGYIINNINNYNQINYYNNYINNILNSIESKYYLLSLNVSIPLSMYYQCLQNSQIYYNLILENAYNDFCTSFPIYYPLNISFLTNYSGVLNNTNNTYLDPNVGIFFYANFLNFNISNNQPQYVLINVSNPSNQQLINYPVFITSTDIFYWLQNGYNLSVKDLNGNNYYFCYLNNNLNCNSFNNNAYGIWVDLNISPYGYVILNISPINGINSYSVDGKEIFPVYDNFSYQNYQQFSQYWTNNTPITISYINYGDHIYSTQDNSFEITYKNSIPKGNYLILFNIQNNGYYNAYIQLGDNCNINLPSFGNPNSLYVYYCYNNDNNDNLQIYGQNIYAYYINLIPYNVMPNIKVIYQPNFTYNYKFIMGPNLTYDFSQYNDLGSSNSNNNFTIYNNNLAYFSYLTDMGNNYYSIPSSYLNIYNLYLFIGFSFYTSEYESYNLTPYVYNDSLALLYLYNSTNLSIKDIIFSNTYWYVFNTEKYYNSNNMIFWNTSQSNYGFVLDSTNIYNKIFNLNNLYNGYLYYYYENGITLMRRYQICTTTTTCMIGSCIQITTCNTYYLDSILYTNYNPIINISYVSSFDNYNNLYFLNATLNDNYNYQNYYFYLYSNPNLDKQTALYLAFSTQIPYIEINYIKPINVINLNNLINLSKDYQKAYFYFNNLNITIFNGKIYQGNIVNNYTYSENFNIYVLNTTMVNTLYKDQLTIYIK